MLLTGTFVRSIDEKQRLAIPKRLRDVLAQSKNVALFVAPGTDGSLAIYTEEAFNQFAKRLAASSPTGSDVRAFSRMFYALAQQVELDDQGRFRIPAELAQWAGLTREAVLLGVQDHMELWDRGRWEAYLQQRRDRYDQIAEAAFGSGLPTGRVRFNCQSSERRKRTETVTGSRSFVRGTCQNTIIARTLGHAASPCRKSQTRGCRRVVSALVRHCVEVRQVSPATVDSGSFTDCRPRRSGDCERSEVLPALRGCGIQEASDLAWALRKGPQVGCFFRSGLPRVARGNFVARVAQRQEAS